jgi:GNAT superfamily N-acetyltransferase
MNTIAMSILIRQWRSTDSIPELTKLLHRAYKPLADMGLRFVATYQDDEMTRKRIGVGTCFVAERDGMIIGTINYRPPGAADGTPWYEARGVAYFGQFAVEPALQHAGIGKMLLTAAEDAARSDGATELAFDTSEQATHLIEYYTRHGFRFIEHVRWPDVNYRSVVMSKSLH